MQESNNWKTEITYGIEVTASEFIIYIQFLRQLHGAGTSHCSQRNADTTSSKISQRNLARKPKNMVLIINEADVSDRLQLSKQIELPVKKKKKNSVLLNFLFLFYFKWRSWFTNQDLKLIKLKYCNKNFISLKFFDCTDNRTVIKHKFSNISSPPSHSSI